MCVQPPNIFMTRTTVTQGNDNLNENKLNLAIKQTRIQINSGDEKRYTVRAPNT